MIIWKNLSDCAFFFTLGLSHCWNLCGDTLFNFHLKTKQKVWNTYSLSLLCNRSIMQCATMWSENTWTAAQTTPSTRIWMVKSLLLRCEDDTWVFPRPISLSCLEGLQGQIHFCDLYNIFNRYNHEVLVWVGTMMKKWCELPLYLILLPVRH